MNRRILRDYTFKILFHVNFYPREELGSQIDSFLNEQESLEPQDIVVLKDRALSIFPKVEELDEQIVVSTDGWKLNRMNKVDLTIIRLALYEMLYDEEVPERVAINEAVELAKKYGGDESHQFVNGVLAKIVSREPVTE